MINVKSNSTVQDNAEYPKDKLWQDRFQIEETMKYLRNKITLTMPH